MAFITTVTPGTQVASTTTIDAGVLNLLASPTVGVTGLTTDLGNFSTTSPTDKQILAYVAATSKWTPLTSQELIFTGATSTVDGVSGEVPKPLLGQQDYFLMGNGSWQPFALNSADTLSLFKLTV